MGSIFNSSLPYLIIGLGGFLGANIRFLVANWAAERLGTTFPYGTLLINVSGSFIIGLFLTVVSERIVAPPNLRLFFATGFLGAYTTFSTFTYESLGLIQKSDYAAGTVNLTVSLGLGMLAVTFGVLLARTI